MDCRITTTQPKDDQRESLIAAASKVFAKQGYRKATLEQICKGMGKVKSFAYYYFRSKEELFEAVIDYEVALFRNELEQALTPALPASKKLQVYSKKRMTMVFELANYFELISNGMLTNPTLTEKLRRKYDQKEVEHIRQILQQGVDSGEFNLKEVELTSVAYFTVLKGLELPLYSSQHDSSNLSTRIDNLLAIIFNGILSK